MNFRKINKKQFELMKAVGNGELNDVKEIVMSGVDPNFSTNDSIYVNPLSMAAHKGYYDIVKWLVDEGGASFDEDFVAFIAGSGQIQITDFLARRLSK